MPENKYPASECLSESEQEEAAESRCIDCPMRVVPPSRLRRLAFGILHGVSIPKPPAERERDNCKAPVDLIIGEVMGTDTLGFSFFGQTVSGDCPAEEVHVESGTSPVNGRLVITKTIIRENDDMEAVE